MTADDRDLRHRFASLRRHEEAQAPGFTAPRAPYPKPFRPRSAALLFAVAACLIAMTTAVLWRETALPRPQLEPVKPVASLLAWKPPTNFLLETPGRELLRTVPAIGGFEKDLLPPTHDRRKLAREKTVLP